MEKGFSIAQNTCCVLEFDHSPESKHFRNADSIPNIDLIIMLLFELEYKLNMCNSLSETLSNPDFKTPSGTDLIPIFNKDSTAVTCSSFIGSVLTTCSNVVSYSKSVLNNKNIHI